MGLLELIKATLWMASGAKSHASYFLFLFFSPAGSRFATRFWCRNDTTEGSKTCVGSPCATVDFPGLLAAGWLFGSIVPLFPPPDLSFFFLIYLLLVRPL